MQLVAKETSILTDLLLVLVAASLFTVTDSSQPKPLRLGGKKQPPKPCRSAACGRLAALLSEAMNSSASPCVDFHEYTCTGWHRTHSQSLVQAVRDVFITNVTGLARRTPIPELHQAAHEKAAQYFVACDNVFSVSQDHLDDVKTLLRTGGITWPDVAKNGDFVGAMFYMSQIVKIPVLLRISLKHSAESKTVVISDTLPLFYIMKTPDKESKQSNDKKFFRVVYEAFSVTNGSDVDRRFKNLVDQKKWFLASANASLAKPVMATTTTSNIHLWTRVTSKRSWQLALSKYWKLSTNDSMPVTIHNRGYFSTVFAHYRKFGEANTMDLFGYMCVQALFPFTNRKIISSYYASEQAAIKHRDCCFHQTDKLMHYAFHQSFVHDILSVQAVKDDLTSLVARVLLSVDDTITAGWLFFGECSAYFSNQDQYLHALTAYYPNRTERFYASFPDMTESPLANWMAVAEVAQKTLDGDVLGTDMVLGKHARPEDSPVEPVYLDVPWYAPDAPPAVKLAGLGSRVATKVFRELLSSPKGCLEFQRNAEALWSCIVSREAQGVDHSENLKDDVLLSILSSGVLWPVLEDLTSGGTSPLADLRTLSEPQLFFVLGCLLLCGEEHDKAKCNLPLKDNVLFARAFSCRRGTPMRPEATCAYRGA